MRQVSELEKDRVYCHHELAHALDVARVAWITFLENRVFGRILIDDIEYKVPGQESEDYDEMAEKSIDHVIGRTDRNYRMEQIKDLIYVCALLHDIGRATQYETGVHHSVAGVSLASRIMDECEVPLAWKQEILNVISEHHQSIWGKEATIDVAEDAEKTTHLSDQKNCMDAGNNSLEYYIRKADHDCRLCFLCEAEDTCKWKEQERNKGVTS